MYTGADSRAWCVPACIQAQQASPEALLYVYGHSKSRPSPYFMCTVAASRYCIHAGAASRACGPTGCIWDQQAAPMGLRFIFGRSIPRPWVYGPFSGAARRARGPASFIWAQQAAPSYSSCDWRARFDSCNFSTTQSFVDYQLGKSISDSADNISNRAYSLRDTVVVDAANFFTHSLDGKLNHNVFFTISAYSRRILSAIGIHQYTSSHNLAHGKTGDGCYRIRLVVHFFTTNNVCRKALL